MNPLEHPEFLQRLAIIVVIVALTFRGLALFFQRVPGRRDRRGLVALQSRRLVSSTALIIRAACPTTSNRPTNADRSTDLNCLVARLALAKVPTPSEQAND